jgi:DNA polymerase IV
VAADLQRKGYRGRTIGIKLRFDDFRTVTRDHTLPAATADATTIRRAAGQCLKRVDLTRRLRLLGVRAGGLTREQAEAAPAPAAGRRRAVAAASSAVVAEPSLFDDERPDPAA